MNQHGRRSWRFHYKIVYPDAEVQRDQLHLGVTISLRQACLSRSQFFFSHCPIIFIIFLHKYILSLSQAVHNLSRDCHRLNLVI